MSRRLILQQAMRSEPWAPPTAWELTVGLLAPASSSALINPTLLFGSRLLEKEGAGTLVFQPYYTMNSYEALCTYNLYDKQGFVRSMCFREREREGDEDKFDDSMWWEDIVLERKKPQRPFIFLSRHWTIALKAH
ncbi:hypothetical protein Tco_1065901 [Tanacetum coccineum]